MNHEEAKNLIRETFQNTFDEGRPVLKEIFLAEIKHWVEVRIPVTGD